MTDYKVTDLTEATTLATTDLLYVVKNPATTAQDRKASLLTVIKGAGGREGLTADRTYYVRTDGLDTNDGLTSGLGGAFLTVQHAVDVVMNDINLNEFDVIIQLADGTYTENVIANGTWTGSGTVTIKGNTSTPTAVTIAGGTGNAVSDTNSSRLLVQDFAVTGAVGLYCRSSYLGFSNIVFGATTDVWCNAGFVECLGNYSVAAGTHSVHLKATNNAYMECTTGITCTLTGTPAFSGQFVQATFTSTIYWRATFSGSATGQRYSCQNQSLIYFQTNTEAGFPGSTQGARTFGSQAGQDIQPYILKASSTPITSNTTLANMSVPSPTLFAGRSYIFRVRLHTTSNVAGGIKFQLTTTSLTTTSCIYSTKIYEGTTLASNTRTTAFDTPIGITAVTVAYVEIEGSFTVNAGGTIRIDFAQNASNAAASTLLAGSSLEIVEIY